METYDNSNFYHGNLKVEQIGGPEEWEANGGKPNWILMEDMSYYLGPSSKKRIGLPLSIGVKITMLKGFISDGGSFNNKVVPMVGSQTGRYFRAYILHDILCRTDHFTFKEANIILDEALKLLEMGWAVRQRIFYPLNWFGSAVKDPELLKNAKNHIKVEYYEIIEPD